MKKILFLLCLFLFPMSVFAENELLSNAESGILIDADSGKILFEKEKDMQVSVASMTKMVAQIVILEEIEAGNIKWNDIVTVSRNASSMGGSQIYLEEGEKMSVEDLMKGISVASGNDATVAMAEYISGSEEKFVKRMNEEVKKLGLKNTNFKNCTGLDEKDHFSTSYDMAMIARELVINHPEVLRFSSIYEDYLRKDTDRKFWLVNTNKLVNIYEGVDGLKTGHTDDAGYCMAVTAKRNGLRLIGIIMKEDNSKVRNSEAMALLDYGFQNYKVKTILKKSKSIGKIKVLKGIKNSVKLRLFEDLTVLDGVDKDKNYTYSIDSKGSVSAPIKVGDIVGKIIVYADGKRIKSINLTVAEEIAKAGIADLYKQGLRSILNGQ
ncbi:MAG: D-alanyl-D-alanine carboxypeptidase [Bacilli bacterium]|nr:D-alanyl-D-alanine carboxypeptidase [Bacilli bacterium]